MDSRNKDGENKSLGGALVDVFDAAVSLVRSELTAIARRAGDLVKAKGLGAVLLLAAAAPLSLALIFLILFVFFGLERLGLGAWAASLLIGIASLIVTAGLILFGIRKLTEEVPEGGRQLSEVEKDDLKYGQQAHDVPGSRTEVVPGVYKADTTGEHGTRPGSTNPTSGGSTNSHGSTSPIAKKTVQGQGPLDGDSALTHSDPLHDHPSHATANPIYTPGMPSAPARATTPVGGRQADTEGLHKGLQSTSTGNVGETGKNAPAERGGPAKSDAGIPVSTTPTYRDDMKKEGY